MIKLHLMDLIVIIITTAYVSFTLGVFTMALLRMTSKPRRSK